jgi:hypothetical protein
MLRRNRTVFAVATVALAVLSAKLGPIHHLGGSKSGGFWDGPI